MMKKVVQTALLGALIGLSTSYMIITIILVLNPAKVINGQRLLLECILAIFLGAGCGLISLIFRTERWSIAVKLVVHYVVILMLVLVCGAIGDWYESPVVQPFAFIVFLAIQSAIYLVIFSVIHWVNVREVERINEKLKGR
ncbi:DUF3021 domain-containing protein [Bacillus sp. CECT 9360]|uniref:DUF3021 domain-containing protein n=1 Tax=Bacillus sp. CECT 9360 TaxID=2845821 RepID=UPI001E5ADF3A|nr:DUF3021 domain-containing protein [Bacillus sp. CECT 9360]CAH0345991.1 hypothetical protein BCI9360_02301 [Bacillus sp. CECT 9360]